MKHKYPFGRKAADYFLNLNIVPSIPPPASIINPYTSSEVSSIVKTYFNKFYNDYNGRVFIFGINPGRFGGGITGIPFTDPAALENYCGICSSFPKKRELSSIFVYKLINEMGGAAEFFSKFFLTALFPFALTAEGKNLNYYDKPELFSKLKKYITKAVQDQFLFGAKNCAVSFGKKNADYLNTINSELDLFKKIIILEHPRFIMQYRRKYLKEYLENYRNIISSI